MFDKGLGVYLIFLSVVYTLSVLHLGFNIQMLESLNTKRAFAMLQPVVPVSLPLRMLCSQW